MENARRGPDGLRSGRNAGKRVARCGARAGLCGGREERHGGRLTEFHPTRIELPSARITERGKRELVRNLEEEQGFAHRALPLGEDLVLIANGNLTPTGDAYKEMLYKKGQSASPGDRVVLTAVTQARRRPTRPLSGRRDFKTDDRNGTARSRGRRHNGFHPAARQRSQNRNATTASPQARNPTTAPSKSACQIANA